MAAQGPIWRHWPARGTPDSRVFGSAESSKSCAEMRVRAPSERRHPAEELYQFACGFEIERAADRELPVRPAHDLGHDFAVGLRLLGRLRPVRRTRSLGGFADGFPFEAGPYEVNGEVDVHVPGEPAAVDLEPDNLQLDLLVAHSAEDPAARLPQSAEPLAQVHCPPVDRCLDACLPDLAGHVRCELDPARAEGRDHHGSDAVQIDLRGHVPSSLQVAGGGGGGVSMPSSGRQVNGIRNRAFMPPRI